MERLKANFAVWMAHARRQLDLLLGPTVASIAPPEAKALLDAGQRITFVDVRNPSAWSRGETKLPGAIRIELHRIEAPLQDLPRDVLIVTYCT
ncbi:MAG: hypothetical protein GEU99_04435 [Luteitalea sp.]|nr:hypothetical protein [Luteitalea sp.]